MADEYFTKTAFARFLRGQREFGPEWNDDEKLVDRWMATHPDDRRYITPPATRGGALGTTAITVARVAPALVGTAIGGTMGAVAGGIGAVPGGAVGGAAGSAVGELIAEGIENFLGRREGFNPWAIGTETALGAIPFTKMRGMSRAAKIAGEGAKGFAMGAGSNVALSLAEGREIDPRSAIFTGGLGAVVGTAGAGYMTRIDPRLGNPTVNIKEYERLQRARAKAEADSNQGFWEGVKTTLRGGKRRLVDRAAPAKSFVEDLAGNKMLRITDDAGNVRDITFEQAKREGRDPATISELKLGSVGAQDELSWRQMDDLERRLLDDDEQMYADVQQLLDLRGFRHGSKTIEEKIRKLFTDAEYADSEKVAKLLEEKGSKLRKQLLSGKALPEGMTPASVEKQLKNVVDTLSEDPDRWARVQGYATELHDFNRETLEIIRKTGGVDNKLFDTLVNRAVRYSKKREPRPGDPKLTKKGTPRVRQPKYEPDTKGWSDEVDDVTVGFVPLLRFMDAMWGVTRRGTKNPLQPLTGSERATINPFGASIMRRRSALLFAAENNSKRAFLDFRDLNADFEKSIVKAVGKNPIAPKGMSTVSAWKNGKREHFFVPEEVATVLNNLDDGATSLLGELGVDFLTKLTQRSATSLNFAFSITNVLRDVSDVALLRQVVKTPAEYPAFALEWARAVAGLSMKELRGGLRTLVARLPREARQVLSKKISNKLPHGYQEAAETGALFSGLTRSSLMPSRKVAGQNVSIGSRILAPVDWALTPVAKISNILEETTKLASFNHLTKKGITGNRRAILTRRYGGSPDFAIRGADSRQVGRMFLFFNAQMQGITRNFRAIKDIGKDLRTVGGAASVMGTMIPATGMEMLRLKHNASKVDPDGTLAMDRITDADRENYWTWVTDDLEEVEGVVRHKTVKYSKGHLARILFNPIADVLEAAFHSERKGKNWSPTETTLNLAEQFSPGSMKINPEDPFTSFRDSLIASSTPWVKAPAELWLNKRTYSGVPLEPLRTQSLSPQFRTTDYTSPTAAKAVQAFASMTGIDAVSPIQAQSVVSNIMPGPGDQALAFLDAYFGGKGVGGAASAGFIEPLARRFKGSPGDQVRRDQSNKFYRALRRVDEMHKTVRELAVTEPARSQRYFTKHAHKLKYREALQTINNEIKNARDFPKAQSEPYINQRLALAERLIDEMNQAE